MTTSNILPPQAMKNAVRAYNHQLKDTKEKIMGSILLPSEKFGTAILIVAFVSLSLLPGLLNAQGNIDFTDSENNTLLSIIDEGTSGSLLLNDLNSAPSSVLNKLYNIGGTLFFNGNKLGSNWNTSGSGLYNLNNIGIGVNDPTANLHLKGSFCFDSSPINGYILTSDANGNASWQAPPATASSPWAESNNNIYRNTGNVGIGTDDPQAGFHLNSAFRYSVNPSLNYIMASDASGNASWKDPNTLVDKQWTESGDDIYYSDGKVGIGIEEPLQDLHINEGLRIEDGIIQSGETFFMRFRDFEGSTFMQMLSVDGYVSIGKNNSPSTRLDVRQNRTGDGTELDHYISLFENPKNPSEDDVRANGIAIIAGRSSNNGADSKLINFMRPTGGGSIVPTSYAAIVQDKTNEVAYYTSSDARLKENIVETQYGLEELLKIEVVDYNFKSAPKEEKTTGFLAQQLYEHYPEAVHVGGEDMQKDPWMVEYGALTPILVKSVQEQQEKIDAVKVANEQIKAENKALEARINTMESDIEEIKALLTNKQ